MIICLLGTKVCDSLLRDEEGNLYSIHPDTFYECNCKCYWMIKMVGMRWKILRVLGVLKV